VTFPLNISGDAEGCTLDRDTHEVTTPKGFKEAYAKYVEGGWPALSADPEWSGRKAKFKLPACMMDYPACGLHNGTESPEPVCLSKDVFPRCLGTKPRPALS